MFSASLLNQPNTVLLETNLIKTDENRDFLFTNPTEILEAFTLSKVESILRKIEDYIEKDFYLAGYISYEAGYLFEDGFKEKLKDKLFSYPLLWFGVYKNPIIQVRLDNNKEINTSKDFFSIQNMRMNLNASSYQKKILQILSHIEKGETYQVNFTFPIEFDFDGDVISFYESLKSAQKVPYSALLNDGKKKILSLSPELFFKIKNGEIIARPMKGTYPRGISRLDDKYLLQALKSDSKIKAENSMIVDLIRNDLGKISEIGSVRVEKLLDVEEYETLFQMTSTVISKLKKNLTYFELFKAVFPGGSITGAPKYKTMQIIAELENSPRGIYTGAIGFISKDEAIFNIPIRTIEIEKNKGKMGIGSGIIWDSVPEKEYQECILKQRFLQNAIPFQLIESILLKNGHLFLLKSHLNRLRQSANFFGFIYDEEKIIKSLMLLKEELSAAKKSRYKIKLLLFRTGHVTLEYSNILKQRRSLGRIQISQINIYSTNIFQYHKTTNRKNYDDEYNKAIANNLTDYVYLNEMGEITETSIYNIFIKKDNFYYTPTLLSGALAGTMIEYLLKKGKIKEKTLTTQEIKSADRIYLCNSIRGIMRVSLT